MGVPSKLLVYRGFDGVGHGPSRPRSSRELMQHKLDWFTMHLWGEPATGALFER